jgi:hypothetical protein
MAGPSGVRCLAVKEREWRMGKVIACICRNDLWCRACKRLLQSGL